MAQPAFLHLHGHPDVAFWNARDGLRVKSSARIAVSSRGTLLVVDDDGLVFHDTMTWKHTVWPESEAVPSMRQSIACSADGSLIALGTIAGELLVYAYPSGRVVLREPLLQGTDLQMAMTVFRHLGESPFGIQQLEFDPSARLVAGANQSGWCVVMDINGGQRLFQTDGLDEFFPRISLAGARVMVQRPLPGKRQPPGNRKATWRIHEMQSGKVLWEKTVSASAHAILCDAQGDLAAFWHDESLEVWDWARNELLARWHFSSIVDAARPCLERNLLAVGCRDGAIWVVPTREQAAPSLVGRAPEMVDAVAWLQRGAAVLSMGASPAWGAGVIDVWDALAPFPDRAPLAHEADVTDVQWLGETDRFLTAGRDGTVRLWGSDGRLLATSGRMESIEQIRLINGGEQVVAAGNSRGGRFALHEPGEPWNEIQHLHFLDVAGLGVVRPALRWDTAPAPVAAHPDGSVVVCCRSLGLAIVAIDVQTGSVVARHRFGKERPDRSVMGMTASPTQLWVVVRDVPELLRFTLPELGQLPSLPLPKDTAGYSDAVLCLSHQGDRIALGAYGRIVIIDAASGTELYSLSLKGVQEKRETVEAVAWSRDGRFLAGAIKNRVLVWDCNSREMVKEFRGHLLDVRGLAWNPDGRLLVSVGADGAIIGWKM
jgi:WD40 repeat protein